MLLTFQHLSNRFGGLSAAPDPMKTIRKDWPRVRQYVKAGILTANGGPMTADEIVAAVGDTFTPWKVKNTLKKKSSGPKAVFTVADGKFSVKAAA
jgi:hypothetical protein